MKLIDVNKELVISITPNEVKSLIKAIEIILNMYGKEPTADKDIDMILEGFLRDLNMIITNMRDY